MTRMDREARPRGFHALETKIHELEESDRAKERERAARPDAPTEEREEAFEWRAPPAHDE